MRCPQRVLSPAWPQPPVGLTEWHKGCRKWDGAGRGVALGALAPHFFHGGDSSAWVGDALPCWGRGGQAEPCSPSCTGLAPCVPPQGGMRMQTLALTAQQGAARLPGALPLLEEGVCQQWKIQVPSCRAEPWSCRAVVSRGPLSLSSTDCLPLPALREDAGGYSEQWGQNGDVSVGTMDTLRTSGQGGWLGPGVQSHVMAYHHVPPGAVLMCNRTVCSFRSKRPPYPLLRGPDPVCLHHLSSCAEPVNHTAGGQGPSQGTVELGAALGFLIDTSTFPLPAPCPQPLTELWTISPPPPPQLFGAQTSFHLLQTVP